MQLLWGSTAPSPEFVALSLLVLPDSSDLSRASMGEPMMIASPLATVSSAAALKALKELHNHLTYGLKAMAMLNNCPKDDKVAVELLHSDGSLISGMQVFRPLSANGMGLYYRLIQGDMPMLEGLSSLALPSHQSGTSGGKPDKTKLLGLVLSVGLSGSPLALCSSSIQYTYSQRMNDCIGLLSKIGSSDVGASKGVLFSFLMMEDECRKTNAAMESRSAIILPEFEEDSLKGVISPLRGMARKTGNKGNGQNASTDIVLPMELTSSADTARTMVDNLTLLSLAETDTFLRKYESTLQERKASLDLAGGTKSRFSKRKGGGKDADFDNFDYKGPARESVKQPARLLQKLAPEPQDTGQAAVVPGKSTQLKLSKKDTKTKAAASVPTLNAHKTDGVPSRSRRTSNTSNSRLQFDDDTSTQGQSVIFDGNSVASVNRVQVNIALNEDLSCSYSDSQLSSCVVEGVVQVQVKLSSKVIYPFHLLLRDPSAHIGSLQENRKFCEDATEELLRDNEREYADRKFTIKIPKPDNYFPVLRYKCSPDLRPVPMRVQTRVKVDAGACRVALQISSNPNNSASLTDLTIIMNVPELVIGETLMTQPAGGVWDATKHSVIWCVSELGGGEKFQLQARFETANKNVSSADLHFPVMVRCQCLFAQLSDIELEVRDIPEIYPAEMAMKVARRFRLSHRERS